MIDSKVVEDLKLSILREFASVPVPEANKIAVENDWDAESINDDFSNFLEKPVDVLVLEEHAQSLAALTPDAFVFFLKDYLLHALDYSNCSSDFMQNLIFRLGSVEINDKYWAERIKLFSSPQAKVVSDFCSFLIKLMPESENFLKEHLEIAIMVWNKVANR